jgi:hypothetical protein
MVITIIGVAEAVAPVICPGPTEMVDGGLTGVSVEAAVLLAAEKVIKVIVILQSMLVVMELQILLVVLVVLVVLILEVVEVVVIMAPTERQAAPE